MLTGHTVGNSTYYLLQKSNIYTLNFCAQVYGYTSERSVKHVGCAGLKERAAIVRLYYSNKTKKLWSIPNDWDSKRKIVKL